MIIDESVFKDGLSTKILAELIARHTQGKDRLYRLRDYYCGRHSILNRSRKSSSAVNNRLVCNHAKYIVDMAQSYLLGNPVSYAASEGFDIEPIKDSYLIFDSAALDAELEKSMSIYGTGYELVYADEHSNPKSAQLSPMNSFVVYASDMYERPLLGVHYFKRRDLHGKVLGVVCTAADKDYIYSFESGTDNFYAMRLVKRERHFFGAVPFIEYCNNEERQGDFEQLIPLIDAYNLLQSDRINDKEQFVDAFLFLSGVELDSSQAQKLKEERILMGYEGAQAQYLSKVMSENDIEVLCDAIKRDIHRFSMIPDLSDESFGGNLSGVAIKYKLMGFEQHIRNKERAFSKGLRKRFMLYNHFLSLRGAMENVPLHRVDIVFTRNLPVNELEVSQMIQNLNGIASSETLLSRLSFVNDPKEEAELARREREKGVS